MGTRDSCRVVTEYVLSRFEAEELERERLRLLERFHDPLSIRLFDAIGVTEDGAASTSARAPGRRPVFLPTGSVKRDPSSPRISTPGCSSRSRAAVWRCGATTSSWIRFLRPGSTWLTFASS